MVNIDELYNTLSDDQKRKISKKAFIRSIAGKQLDKLNQLNFQKDKRFRLNEFKEFYFNKLHIDLNNIRPGNNDRCMYPYCRNRDIKASHVISETFLRLICNGSGKKENILYTPDAIFDLEGKEKKCVVRPLGVSKAFRFPGFCEKHENWFDFEKTKDLNDPTDVLKQIFRSLCYDKYLQQLIIDTQKKAYHLIAARITEKADKIINENNFLDISLTRYQDFQTRYLKKQIFASCRRRREVLKEINTFKRQILSEINGKDAPVIVSMTKLAGIAPVSISHCGMIKLTDGSEETFFFALIILIPLLTGSLFIISGRDKDEKSLQRLSKIYHDEGNFESMLYYTMSRLTDNWLIDPNFWDNFLSTQSKDELLRPKTLF